jgi:hypothetical protein
VSPRSISTAVHINAVSGPGRRRDGIACFFIAPVISM